MLAKSNKIAIIAAALCMGCGSDDTPDLGPVTGTVKLDGKPLANAQVEFQPQNGRPSVAKTNEDGEYELIYNTRTGAKGTKIGINLVTISTSDSMDGKATAEQVPAKYNVKAEENPEMTVDVKPDGNEFHFDLDANGEIIDPNEGGLGENNDICSP